MTLSYEERLTLLWETYASYSRHDDLLPNPHKCTERDILNSRLFGCGSIGRINHRGVTSENGRRIHVEGLYFYDGSWVGMSGHWSDPHITWWMGAICEHDYEVHENYNTCQHSKTCKKCGYTETWGSD